MKSDCVVVILPRRNPQRNNIGFTLFKHNVLNPALRRAEAARLKGGQPKARVVRPHMKEKK